MRRICILVIFISLLVASCSSGDKRLKVDVSDVKIPEVIIHRYDLDLFSMGKGPLQQGLEVLKPSYRFFLDTDLGNPVKLAEMKAYLENPRNVDFYQAVNSAYKDIGDLEKQMTFAFRHYLHYYPDSRLPVVFAYVSGGDYDYPVQFADSVLLIGLDNYLGGDYKAYVADGLPVYRLTRMTPGNIIPDCMRVLANITQPAAMPGNTLLEQMVEAGKKLYFIDAMIPGTPDRYKIGYSQSHYDWIRANESHVWAAIIENKMLFSADGQTIRVFMADGPFTAEFSKDSPARLGEWIGWQIVRHYMAENSAVTLPGLMSERDAQKILTESRYKPAK